MLKHDLVHITKDYKKVCDTKVLEDLWMIASKMTLCWGAEHCSFEIEEGIIYPTEGSSSIIGVSVPLSNYNTGHFCQLIKDTKPSSVHVVCLYLPEGSKKLFDYSKTLTVQDYGAGITHLEKLGYVACCNSLSVLCEDSRRFTVLASAVGVIRELKKYEGLLYEVDSLGSTMFGELTGLIKLLLEKVMGQKPVHTIHYRDLFKKYMTLVNGEENYFYLKEDLREKYGITEYEWSLINEIKDEIMKN